MSMATAAFLDKPTPALAAAAYLQDSLSSSSQGDIPASMAMQAYLAEAVPVPDAASDSDAESSVASIDAATAAAMFPPLPDHPDSDGKSSVGSIDAKTAAAVFPPLPDHPDSDAESSASSIDAAAAAAAFASLPENISGSSMDVDTSAFTLEPPGGVYTASYFNFVQDDWIE